MLPAAGSSNPQPLTLAQAVEKELAANGKYKSGERRKIIEKPVSTVGSTQQVALSILPAMPGQEEKSESPVPSMLIVQPQPQKTEEQKLLPNDQFIKNFNELLKNQKEGSNDSFKKLTMEHRHRLAREGIEKSKDVHLQDIAKIHKNLRSELEELDVWHNNVKESPHAQAFQALYSAKKLAILDKYQKIFATKIGALYDEQIKLITSRDTKAAAEWEHILETDPARLKSSFIEQHTDKLNPAELRVWNNNYHTMLEHLKDIAQERHLGENGIL